MTFSYYLVSRPFSADKYIMAEGPDGGVFEPFFDGNKRLISPSDTLTFNPTGKTAVISGITYHMMKSGDFSLYEPQRHEATMSTLGF